MVTVSITRTAVVLLFGVFLFPTALCAQAQLPAVVITEIAASLPSDEEWVEIYNTTGEGVDIASWRFVEGFTEGDPDGVRHKLTSYRGDSLMDSREYAIIANNAAVFLEKHSNFSGTLFDSSWSSLKESGEKMQLVDGNGLIVEEFFYISSDGILARKDPLLADYSAVNWVSVYGKDTPGRPYDAIALTLPPAESTPATSAPPVSPQEPLPAPSSTEIFPLEPPIVNAGADVAARIQETITFDGSRSYDSRGAALSYNWEFGDGEKAAGAIVSHAFAREGDYRVRLTVTNSVGVDSDDVRVTVVGEIGEPAPSVLDEPQALTPTDAAVLPSRTEAIMEGIVTVEPGIFAKTYFYITSKDGRSGVQVYAADGAFPDLHIGQLVEVAGRVSSYYGVKRIIIDTPEAISVTRGADPPPPKEVAVSLVSDAHLGRLITIVGEVVKEEGKIFISGDDGASVRVEVKPETGVSKTDMEEGAIVSITGIVDQTRSGARLLPRYPGDVTVVAGKNSELSNNSRVLGEKAEIFLPEVEYTPAPDVLEYTTDAESRSPVLKYLVATAAALVFVLIGIFMRERQNTERGADAAEKP